MTETRVPPRMCPHCGHMFDAAECLFDPKVKPCAGDVSMCIHCAGVLVFDPFLTAIKPPDGFLDSLRHTQPHLLHKIYLMQEVIREANRHHSPDYPIQRH